MEEILRFLASAPSNNRFWTIRKVVISLAYLGGNRLCELRHSTQSSLERCAEGYIFNFTPAKQRGHVRTSKFLIPRGKTSAGVCFATLIDNYREALNYDNVPLLPSSPFLYTGRPASGSKPSKFINSPVGENSLRKFGVDMATFLELPHPQKYTGHCFRRSAATQLAATGASEQQMKDKFGWKDGAMCNEYIATSKPILKRNAAMLSGLNLQEKESKVPKVEDEIVPQIGDASELWGDDLGDEDLEQAANDEELEKDESGAKNEDVSDGNGNIPKSFLKGFNFQNCTVNFQLPGSS